MARIDSSRDVSVLITDIRNFTPNLKSGKILQDGNNIFCQFLARFYDCCVQACITACGQEEPRPLYLNSTGDGVLSVFLSPERHFLDAYLAGIILCHTLPPLCEEYNQEKPHYTPDVSFGIGLESGSAWRVISYDTEESHTRIIETFIGDCIDVAARVETSTKDHARTFMLLSKQINQLLCTRLFDENYHELVKYALDEALSDDERKYVWDKMTRLNERLMVTFLGNHNMKGVLEPVPLFRLSPTLARPKRVEFQDILRKLSRDEGHYQRIIDLIE